MQGLHIDLLVLDQPGLAAPACQAPGWRGLIDEAVVLAPAGDGAPADVAVVDPAASPADLAALICEVLGNYRAGPLRWGEMEVDFRCREARWMGHRLDITPMQLRLLGALVEASGAVVSKTDLTWRLFGNLSAQDERVETHIRRIRQRLAVHAGERRVLLTVRGEGYRLADGVGS